MTCKSMTVKHGPKHVNMQSSVSQKPPDPPRATTGHEMVPSSMATPDLIKTSSDHADTESAMNVSMQEANTITATATDANIMTDLSTFT